VFGAVFCLAAGLVAAAWPVIGLILIIAGIIHLVRA
jgi:hypothetical protein